MKLSAKSVRIIRDAFQHAADDEEDMLLAREFRDLERRNSAIPDSYHFSYRLKGGYTANNSQSISSQGFRS